MMEEKQLEEKSLYCSTGRLARSKTSGGELMEERCWVSDQRKSCEVWRMFVWVSAEAPRVKENWSMGWFKNGLVEVNQAVAKWVGSNKLEEMKRPAQKVEALKWALKGRKRASYSAHNIWPTIQFMGFTSKPYPQAQTKLAAQSDDPSNFNESPPWNMPTSETQVPNSNSYTDSLQPRRNSRYKRLPSEDFQVEWDWGLCFKCDEKDSPCHYCRFKQLRLLLMHTEVEDAKDGVDCREEYEEEEEERDEVDGKVKSEVEVNGMVDQCFVGEDEVQVSGHSQLIALIDQLISKAGFDNIASGDNIQAFLSLPENTTFKEVSISAWLADELPCTRKWLGGNTLGSYLPLLSSCAEEYDKGATDGREEIGFQSEDKMMWTRGSKRLLLTHAKIAAELVWFTLVGNHLNFVIGLLPLVTICMWLIVNWCKTCCTGPMNTEDVGKWKEQPAGENYWEDFAEVSWQLPEFHLEDKVIFKRKGGDVRTPINQEYISRSGRGNRGTIGGPLSHVRLGSVRNIILEPRCNRWQAMIGRVKGIRLDRKYKGWKCV